MVADCGIMGKVLSSEVAAGSFVHLCVLLPLTALGDRRERDKELYLGRGKELDIQKH